VADTLQILGQSSPSATTLTDAYTVTAGKSAVVSKVTVSNRSATPTTFRISVAQGGAADTSKQYIAYDVPIDGNDSIILNLGIALAATDVVRVYAGAATLSFNVFGIEVS
jgi:hypothetical protein